MIQLNSRESTHTHRLRLRDFEAFCDPDTFPTVSAELVAKAGGGVPSAEPLPAETEPAPALSTFSETVHDAEAETRIKAQHAALQASGVTVDAPAQLFATGTRLAAEGYATQAARKVEHDAKLPLRDAARLLAERVRGEGREDRDVSAREFADAIKANGKITAFGLALTEQAIRGLTTRLESPVLGYVLGLRDRIAHELAKPLAEQDTVSARADRAKIADVLHHECLRRSDVALRLRTRKAPGDVFAIVSPGYVPADAPDVVAQLADDLPRDAKGSWAYDPTSTAWELRASVWTPTPVDEQAVGEAFEGYVSYQSKDNGQGRFNGGGGVLLIRCLNASTYTADDSSVSRVHRGRILVDVARVTERAKRAVSALCAAWGTTRGAVVEIPDGLTLEQALPGFWRALLTDRRGELARVLPGRTETHVKGLVAAFTDERRDADRLVRSDFAQGWTHYVQDQSTPVRREAEQAIGAWLVNDRRELRCELDA